MGRPPIIDKPDEFDALVEEYQALCKVDGVPITLTGMALHLGFASRQSLYDYGKRSDFSYSLKKGRGRS